LRQVFLVGLGGDTEDQVADLELGGAEEVSGVSGDEGASDLEQFRFGGLGNALGQELGLSFLSGSERGVHGSSSDAWGAFFARTASSPIVYKDSTNFSAAHTIISQTGFFSGGAWAEPLHS
jgi:hypothetical protein